MKGLLIFISLALFAVLIYDISQGGNNLILLGVLFIGFVSVSVVYTVYKNKEETKEQKMKEMWRKGMDHTKKELNMLLNKSFS